MRAEDVLADTTDRADFGGVTVRKGTIAAFLMNAKILADPAVSEHDRLAAERDIVDALPALNAVGLFDVLAPRNDKLRRLIADAGRP